MTCCDDPSHVVELRDADGTVGSIRIPTGESIVDAAESAGIDLPYGCLYGACGTCTARLLEGTCTHQEPPRALKDDVLEGGYVLTCVATPVTDCTLRVGHDVQAEAIGTPWR
ncbi:2Fe-2S iron-sulfur cluster-binding protein [Natronococcus sp. A-GB1]|uniref:2Fe-2S iron-sulfur cluster-binding protein n=1 Tax=Natronococcus sp. A-GB1 TaxID=3037648 RepID=UPI00241C8C61|nr:2Fe-2S iron-sulfur cluster-binding protein [Natronococcus sp. A-GB1]MDG5758065.1 2Fe-2S iron-sulfur cluster-binding protein [Natronococcus sp. A-GB1]